jgi:drug/metabolite transporter (DMT)-like permease
MGTYIRLTLAALFWGGTFVAGKLVVREMGPYPAAFIRFFLASLFLLPLLLRCEGRLPPLDRRQLGAVVLLGLSGVFAYNFFFFSGLKTVEAGRAALIIASNPVFIAIFSFLLFGERFSALRLAGILLSVTGGMVVISRGNPLVLLQGELGRGELFLLGCVFSWVTYTLIGKKVMTGLKPLTAVTYSCIAGTAALSIPALQGDLIEQLAGIDMQTAFNIVYLAFFGTALGFVWFYRGVNELGPTRAGLFINLVPVSGVVLGILILGETPSLSLLGGGLLVVTGLILTNR